MQHDGPNAAPAHAQPQPPVAPLEDVRPPDSARADARQHQRALLRGARIVALGAGLLVLFALVMGAVVFLHPEQLDLPITRAVQSWNFPLLDVLMPAVSWPGFTPWNFIIPLLLMAGLAALRRGAEAAFLGLATVAAGSGEIVKAIVGRGRPSPDLVHVVQHLDSSSFPSGHVTEYTLVLGFLFYLSFTLLRPGLVRTILLIFSGAMIVLVGPSRIWMGQHWASDVLGGYTLGFGLLLLIIWAYRAYEARRLTHQVPAGVAARKS